MSPPLLRCPECDKLSFDGNKGQCQSCGMRGTPNSETFALTDSVLEGLLENIRLRLTEVDAIGFQQLLGVFSPRAGRGQEDGIPFTADDCATVQRRILQDGILCARFAVTADRRTTHSLVFANTEAGIKRGIAAARKEAARARARLEIIRLSDA